MPKLTKIEAMQRIAAEDMETLRKNGELIVCVTPHRIRVGCHTESVLRIERRRGVAAESTISGSSLVAEVLTTYCRSLAPAIEELTTPPFELNYLKAALAAAGWNLEQLADERNVAVFRLSRAA